MAAPRLPSDMIEDAKQQLEQYFKTLDRLAVSKKTARSRFVHWDAIARTYFYLGQDDEAQSYFYQSIEGAKEFYAEKKVEWDSKRSRPSTFIRGLYDIARPLWWVGEVTGRDYFEQAIVFLKTGWEDDSVYERRRSLSYGICFLIAIDEMERANLWLDELEYKYGLSSRQKSLEVYRAIIEHSSSDSSYDLEAAFDQLSRQERLRGQGHTTQAQRIL